MSVSWRPSSLHQNCLFERRVGVWNRPRGLQTMKTVKWVRKKVVDV